MCQQQRAFFLFNIIRGRSHTHCCLKILTQIQFFTQQFDLVLHYFRTPLHFHGNFFNTWRKFFRYISLSLSQAFSFSFLPIDTHTRLEEAFRHDFSFHFSVSLIHSSSLRVCLRKKREKEMFNSIIHSHSSRVSRNIREGGKKSLFFIISSSASSLEARSEKLRTE